MSCQMVFDVKLWKKVCAFYWTSCSPQLISAREFVHRLVGRMLGTLQFHRFISNVNGNGDDNRTTGRAKDAC